MGKNIRAYPVTDNLRLVLEHKFSKGACNGNTNCYSKGASKMTGGKHISTTIIAAPFPFMYSKKSTDGTILSNNQEKAY
jgi:hypothetical protein